MLFQSFVLFEGKICTRYLLFFYIADTTVYFSAVFFPPDEILAKSASVNCISAFEGPSGSGTLREKKKSCSLVLL